MRAPALIHAILLLTFGLCSAAPRDRAADARPAISAAEYHQRRAALCARLDSASAALFRAAEPKWRNGDVDYPYRQESNYLYLTGETKPSGVLVLVPAAITVGRMRGRIIHIEGASTKDSSAGDELFLCGERLREVLDSLAGRINTLYVSAPDLRFVNDWLNDRPLFVDRDARREFEKAHPGLTVKSASGLVGGLREVKSAAELGLMRRAIAVTGDGFIQALKACKQGSYEYELQAAIEAGMRRGGAEGIAFPSIIGSGPNSLVLHYDENSRRMEKGDVVVMDIGAEFGGYAADVTRTIPVSGTFTPEQKKVYAAVKSAHDEVIKLIKPGIARSVLEARARQVIADAGFARFTLHGISHQVGIDVHDAGASDTLKTGMVITVEPGIYIPVAEDSLAKPYRGVGIRLEDDVLVTPSGAEVLSSSIPIEAGTIEKLMK